MKRIYSLGTLLLICVDLLSQDVLLTLTDASTGRELTKEDGIVVSYSISVIDRKGIDSEFNLVYLPPALNCSYYTEVYDSGSFYGDKEYRCAQWATYRVSVYAFQFEVTSSNFETKTFQVNIIHDTEADLYGQAYELVEVPLVRKKQVVDATIDLNMNPSNTMDSKGNQGANELGLYTPASIAKILDVSIDDVMKLINEGEIKYKKIGENIFITKEYFDEYMKK
jgi:excisionase family DNA binding protein